MTASAPPRNTRPTPPPTAAQQRPATTPPRSGTKSFTVSRGKVEGEGRRIVLYGTGGIGKTSLCALLAGSGRDPLFLDVEDGTKDMDVARIGAGDLATLEDLVASLAAPDWDAYGAVVIDSATKVEELIAADVCRRSGVDKLENVDGGYGKGYRAMYEGFLRFLSSLDAHIRAGRDVVLICHETKAKVPNPSGEDFYRFEPRLYHSDKNSLRERVKEWADHVFALLYDVDVSKGKAKGVGTRTIYTQEMPTHVAKSRTLSGAIAYREGDPELWAQLFGKQ